MRSLLCAAVSLLALATSLPAQFTYEWVHVTPGLRPPARNQHAMVYDHARGVTLLFGGFNGGYLNDTWSYDGNAWQRLSPPTRPPARSEHDLVYDPRRQRVVLVGGTNGADLRDTWEWDGQDWNQVASNVTGLGAEGGACFDPRQGGVFFSRYDNSVNSQYNLLWDGSQWQNVNVANPVADVWSGIFYSARLGGTAAWFGSRMNVFEPRSGWSTAYRSSAVSIGSYALAVDAASQTIVLQGGSGSIGSRSGSGFRETWAWSGSGWAPLPDLPEFEGHRGRYYHAMVFDARRDVFVHFGGATNSGTDYTNVTAELQRHAVTATYTTFGSGCATSNGVRPELRPDALFSPAPLIGSAFTLELTQAPHRQPAALLIGDSRSTYGSISLPLLLDAYGMPGCTLLVAPTVTHSMGTTTDRGNAWVTLPIPGDPALLGTEFFVQTFIADPPVNSTGFVWSDAGAAVIGNRL